MHRPSSLAKLVLARALAMASHFSLSDPVIERGPPGAVRYDLSEPGSVTITLPVGSTWSSGLHWHERHVEYLRVVKGCARVVLGNQVHTVAAGDETTELRVDRYVWHEWSRTNAADGDEVVVVERTDPEDGQKALFFWNLNGVILKAQSLACPPYMTRLLHGMLLDIWVMLGLFAAFRDLDNFPVLINIPAAFSKRGFTFTVGTLGHVLLQTAERFISHLVLFVVSWIAWGFGIGPVRREFTPDIVWERLTETKRKPKAI